MKVNKHFFAVSLLVLMYAVLLVCIFTVGLDVVKYLPLVLLLSCFVVGLFHTLPDTRFVIYIAIVFFSSLALQVIGVGTGAIFGQFLYGTHLGVTIFDTPLIIGILWLLLSYTTAVFASQILSKSVVLNSVFAKVFLAALLMVSMNMLMEQSAAACDWWYWKYQVTPVQNYTAWFAFSVAFNFLFYKLEINTENKIARWLFVIIWLFFFGLAIAPVFWMSALS